MEQIADWLKKLGMAQYAEAFADNDIDFSVLRHLTDQHLKDLGLSLGHRLKMLQAIHDLGETSAAATASVPAPTRPARQDDAERRQLTVMFTDLVGSTALSTKLDPEDLRSVIGAYHKCVAETVARFDGFVAKYMGDGVLVYFGYPQAHEDDAERAVRAGLALVEAVGKLRTQEPLQVRLGVATGLVVVGDIVGSGEAQERGVVGETPNLAARLQGLAEPGSLALSAATRRLLAHRFRLRSLGPQWVKGLAEPVEAFAVEGVSVAESRFESVHAGLLTGFVGREHELGLLIERWDLAYDGEGQVVLLAGEPGIGKSRILRELRERLEAEGTRSLRFHCSPYYVNSAFYPIVDNFERTLQFARGAAAEEKLDKLEALIVGEYGRPREDVRFIASMLSIPWEARYGALAMTPQRFKEEILRALVDAVEAVARRQPTVMLFEDAHWADATTLETLDMLLHRVRNVPLLAVITHRLEFPPRWSQHGHVAALSLSKLTPGQSTAMVSRLTSKPLPPDLLEQIIAKTDGVPLFVEELTKSILESGELRDAGDRWDYTARKQALAIPLTLRDSLMARLDRYAPIKEVAQIGAAIGREFSYELIAAVAPSPKPELDEALAQLAASGLAFQHGTPPDAIYTFKHALVQDAAYDSLLKRRRQELHGKIARVIAERFPNIEATEPELLAHHYSEAKQPDKAIPLWEKAGGLALKRMAVAEAIAHLNKGLDLVAALPPSPERDGMELDLRVLLGTAWLALRGWPAQQVWDSLHPALALANALRRNDALLPILWGLWCNVLTTGRIAESLRWVSRLLDAAEEYHDPDLLIVGHVVAVSSYFHLGDPVKAREHADHVLALYSEERHVHLVGILNHDPRTHSSTFTALLTWMLGYPDQAAKIRDARDADARQRRHPFDLGFGLTIGARVFDHLGEPDEQLKRVEEAQRLGREHSLPVLTTIMGPIYSGIALIRKGEFADGISSLKAGLALWEASGGRISRPYLKSVLAEAMAQLGNLGSALDLVEESIAQVERPGWDEREHYAETLRIKGWLLSLKGDLEGAERNYIASLDWGRRQQAKSWELRTATSYARLMRDEGRMREAYDLLAPVYSWFTEGFGTKDLKEAKALLDELAS
jgi:class 3 adenylate cyclase/predicted ATPase